MYQTYPLKHMASCFFSVRLCAGQAVVYVFPVGLFMSVILLVCQFATFSLSPKINLYNLYPEKRWNRAWM